MRELFFKLFEMSHFNTGIQVTAFSIPHFVYLFLIFGGIVLAWRLLRQRPWTVWASRPLLVLWPAMILLF